MMKLIDVLVRDLHKFGGWPDGAVVCHRFVDEATIDFYDDDDNWPSDCSTEYGAIALECVKPRVIGQGISSETVTREQYEAALASSKPEWDGEGLPPVGCECMVRGEIGDNGWYKCKVIAHTFFDGYNCAVFQTESTVSCSSDGNFRPIRSEEDKKRYAAIEALFEVLDAGVSTSQDSIDIYDAIAAGKIPHIRID
ncbi:hypothetical protein [Intestinirhabdus alba]|uniref:Uncharacterized protein n=1 Tax=Intestinirhabdus alba TaxID=2899544 RepID=A0A6L6IFG6_9ENTR|nr:hypothetical protein [Intestinirhabdus alba]MTH45369.1 hypothetical protein [Intestinirhabdus alba]